MLLGKLLYTHIHSFTDACIIMAPTTKVKLLSVCAVQACNYRMKISTLTKTIFTAIEQDALDSWQMHILKEMLDTMNVD